MYAINVTKYCYPIYSCLKKKILDSNNGWIRFTNKPDQQLLNCEELKCLTNSRVWMWELDHSLRRLSAEELMLLNVVLEKILKSPLDSKGSNQSILKEIIPEYSLEELMLKLWPPDAESWLIRKDPVAGSDWGQEEKGVTEDEMVGWHHWLNGHEFEQTLEIVKQKEAWHAAVHRVAKSWTQLSDWTTAKCPTSSRTHTQGALGFADGQHSFHSLKEEREQCHISAFGWMIWSEGFQSLGLVLPPGPKRCWLWAPGHSLPSSVHPGEIFSSRTPEKNGQTVQWGWGDREDKSRLLTLDGSVGGQQLSPSGAELGRPCPCTPSSSKVAWCVKVPVEVALLLRNTYQPFQKQLQNAGQIYTFSLTSLLLDCAILPSSICHLRAILISRTIFIKSFSVIRI